MYSPLETLAFFETLGTSITTDELFEYTGQKTPPKNFEVYKSLIIWPGKNAEKTFQKREKQNQIKKEYVRFSKKYLKLCQWIPYIKTIHLCNNITLNNCTKDSDIDLFIVTKKNRLFIARTIITIFFHLLGVRRHGNKVQKRFCLSFFVSEEANNLEKFKIKPKDVYMDFWIKSLNPILNNTSNVIKNLLEFILSNKIGDLIEKTLMNHQLKRCRRKISKLKNPEGNIVSETILKFHNTDMRKYYFKKWERIVRDHCQQGE